MKEGISTFAGADSEVLPLKWKQKNKLYLLRRAACGSDVDRDCGDKHQENVQNNLYYLTFFYSFSCFREVKRRSVSGSSRGRVKEERGRRQERKEDREPERKRDRQKRTGESDR